jgi:hypothetical protein
LVIIRRREEKKKPAPCMPVVKLHLNLVLSYLITSIYSMDIIIRRYGWFESCASEWYGK